MNRILSYNDVRYAAVNHQDTLAGTTINPVDAKSAFFIIAIHGATSANPATVKDASGTNTITIIGLEHESHFPLRVDGGFEVTATSSVTVKFCKVPLGN